MIDVTTKTVDEPVLCEALPLIRENSNRLARMLWFWQIVVTLLGLSFGTLLALLLYWGLIDDSAIYVEDETAAHVFPGQIHPGDLLRTHRVLTMVKDCVVRRSYWITNVQESWTISMIDTGVAMKINAGESYTSRIAFYLPQKLPPGHYRAETIAECARNPLVEVQQRLKPLDFDVVP